MSTNKGNKFLYTAGLRNVGSYQVSGHPYITGSNTLAANGQHHIEFPYVTKAVTVINHTNEVLRLHFTDKDQGETINGYHYLELDSDEDSFTFNVKCKELYISRADDSGGNSKYRIYAELTNIPASSMYVLTGSGLTAGSDGGGENT